MAGDSAAQVRTRLMGWGNGKQLSPTMNPALSIIVVAYNMAREIPRTVRSLSPAMQLEIGASDYEIIVVDNGSAERYQQATLRAWGAEVRLVRITDARPSPVRAINEALGLAKAPIIGVMIDGARLASPGALCGALRACQLSPRAVVSTLGFHLGPEIQTQSVRKGYNAAIEDELLEKVRWTEDGYRLFEIAALAGSSERGWFLPTAESNALFMSKEMWNELGGFDERFVMPGGGLANLDTYRRACDLPNSLLVVLLGEGSFHQVHGGVATNALVSPWTAFHDEYVRIRGYEFLPPQTEPLFIGRVPPQALRFIELSARVAREQLCKKAAT